MQDQVEKLLKSQLRVSIFCIKTSLKIMLCYIENINLLNTSVDIPFFGRLLGDTDQCCDYFCMDI